MLIPTRLRHFATSKAGATVVWDLFYFVIEEFEEAPQGQSLEAGEDIAVEWKTFAEVKALMKAHAIKEDRTVGILSMFLT